MRTSAPIQSPYQPEAQARTSPREQSPGGRPRCGLPFGDGQPATPVARHNSEELSRMLARAQLAFHLGHLPGSFFKDLQAKFPEICHAHSGIHRSCLTLSVFTKNRLIREPPQHMSTTRVAFAPKKRFSPIVTIDLFARRPPNPSRARQQAVPENPAPQSPSTPTGDPISTAASAFAWTLSNAPTQPRRRSPFRRFDVSTFRLFDVSTFRRFHAKPPKSRTTPTRARHKRYHNPQEACVTLCHFESGDLPARSRRKKNGRQTCRPLSSSRVSSRPISRPADRKITAPSRRQGWRRSSDDWRLPVHTRRSAACSTHRRRTRRGKESAAWESRRRRPGRRRSPYDR